MTTPYDQIGEGYDHTRHADPFLTQQIFTLLAPESDGIVLDVGCGTGNYTLALAHRGVTLFGIDQSDRMIETAQAKDTEQLVQWRVANVEALPFPNHLFAGAFCLLALHHFSHLKQAMREVSRVLHRGHLVIFTATPEQMQHYWLTTYFPGMMARSMVQMPRFEQICEALTEAGFDHIKSEPYVVQAEVQDGFLYAAKHHPSRYLDPEFRAGISSFRLLAEPTELVEGCQQLAKDIASGAIAALVQQSDQGQTDYLFIAAEKMEDFWFS